MIDPLEAVIAYLRTDNELATLVGDQIATKHQFTSGWDLPSKAVTLKYDSGSTELYVRFQRPRLEVRCYGEEQHDAGKVYRRLVEISRNTTRAVVATAEDGNALITSLLVTTAPTFIRDLDVDIDILMFFMTATVAEQDVP